MFATLIKNYPKDVNNFRDLLQNLDDGYYVDISELEDRSVKNILTDMFKEHFNLKRDKETREYKKRSSQKDESLVKIFEDFTENYKPETTQPKSLLEAHTQKFNSSQPEVERRNLESRGYMTWNRDRDMENPCLAVDKKRLMDTVNNAAKFSQKFNSTTEYKFM
ncbi:predicted protein [Naegleria gruberi]|uniref:Predicted protein n=1 Tax=Naegleria gruberi TaxID=5762 RepID=D2VIF0_NAEGR|nr:uncharacterized protein NAEGRDRAFT_68661 [Naegleria gruberi]EFC43255.1 predicted protein [Naegleria gruberi]|eukprot:XP_002675999.1 predicted protein [Naegleria gruberi strain NEG-M]